MGKCFSSIVQDLCTQRPHHLRAEMHCLWGSVKPLSDVQYRFSVLHYAYLPDLGLEITYRPSPQAAAFPPRAPRPVITRRLIWRFRRHRVRNP